MSNAWDILKPQDSLEYIKYLIENCLSVGLFLESDPSLPVSWAFVSNFGQINGLYTVEEHRRKGYGRVTVLSLMKQILETNMIPLYGVISHNAASLKLCMDLNFVEAGDMAAEMYS